jgi:hypothetical protein
MVIRVAVPTNIMVAKSGETVVGSFLTISSLEPLCAVYPEQGTARSSSSPRWLIPSTALLNCLDFRDFSLLPLWISYLRCAFNSDSNAAITGVSAKKALTLDFVLRYCLRTPAFGKVLMSTGLLWCSLPSEVEGFEFQSDATEWLLTPEFEVKTSWIVLFSLLSWRGRSDSRRPEILITTYGWTKWPYSCHRKPSLYSHWYKCIWQWLTQHEWDVAGCHISSKITSDPCLRGAVRKLLQRFVNCSV